MLEDKETDTGTDELSPEESAYFESGGEAGVKAEPGTVETETEGDEQPKAEETEAPEGKDRDEKGRFVPHQALHAEREEHKKTRSELQELKEFRARMEERMQWFEKGAQPQEEANKPPDPNEDIFAAFEYERKQREALEKQFQESRQQQEQTQQAQQQFNVAFQDLNRSLETFRASAPDVDDASNWLYDVRMGQLKAQGYDDRSAGQFIQQEVFGGIQKAREMGLEPAEYFYQYAKVSGYQPKAAEQNGQNGVQMPEQLQRVAKAQEASKTVGQASGKAGADEMTAEMLSAMSEQEFSAWVNKPENARKFEKMMGG